MNPTWNDIYSTNWHRLSQDDVDTWEWQVRNAIPDLKGEEILAAVHTIAARPEDNRERPRTPKPRDIINEIVAVRGRRHEQSNKGEWGRNFHLTLSDIQRVAETGDWNATAELIRRITDRPFRYRIEDEVLRMFPKYAPDWPDADCQAYERVYGQRCPYWRLDKVLEPVCQPGEPGPLAAVVAPARVQVTSYATVEGPEF